MKLLRMLVLVVATAALPTQVVLAKPDIAKLAQSRADAAAKSYPAAIILWKNGTSSLDAVYQWSVRWLVATIDTTGKPGPAFTEHLKRMQDVEQEAISRWKAQLTSALEADSAAYYRIEAELWEARGKMN
jgi:hypothetical protein